MAKAYQYCSSVKKVCSLKCWRSLIFMQFCAVLFGLCLFWKTMKLFVPKGTGNESSLLTLFTAWKYLLVCQSISLDSLSSLTFITYIYITVHCKMADLQTARSGRDIRDLPRQNERHINETEMFCTIQTWQRTWGGTMQVFVKGLLFYFYYPWGCLQPLDLFTEGFLCSSIYRCTRIAP